MMVLQLKMFKNCGLIGMRMILCKWLIFLVDVYIYLMSRQLLKDELFIVFVGVCSGFYSEYYEKVYQLFGSLMCIIVQGLEVDLVYFEKYWKNMSGLLFWNFYFVCFEF